jgi:uncharacterized protein (TIGR03083 family)
VEPAEHLDILDREAAVFADALRDGNLAAIVPGCPGWSLAELGRHLGSVHRWARVAVTRDPSAGAPRGDSSPPRNDAEVHEWFVEGATGLLHTLRGTDPERPCWTMAPPATARFWLRRQAHETTLHRWDAGDCLGGAPRIAPEVALDGLDEAVRMFLPRQVRLGRLAKAPDVVHLVAGDDRFVVTSDAEHRDDAPLAVVSGAPDALLLLLWGRIGVEDERLRLDGDVDATTAFLGRPLTP